MSKMTTRSTAFLHVLSVLDLDQEAQDILSNMRVTNVSGLLHLTTEALNANLPIGYVNNINTFKHWYFNYRANNNGQSPTDIVSEFTIEIFDDFMVEQVEAPTNSQLLLQFLLHLYLPLPLPTPEEFQRLIRPLRTPK